MIKRLISQSGFRNVPYEISVVCIEETRNCGFEIYAEVPGCDDSFLLARYATKEKAVNVLWLMQYTLAKENIFEFPQEEEIF